MSNLLSSGLLFLEQSAEEPELKDKIFALDWQLLFDAVIVGCAVFFLFFLLSYLVFNPARDLMQKRQAMIEKNIADADKEKEDALAFKKEYDARLKNIEAEADGILADARKRAKSREEAIIGPHYGADQDGSRAREEPGEGRNQAGNHHGCRRNGGSFHLG